MRKGTTLVRAPRLSGGTKMGVRPPLLTKPRYTPGLQCYTYDKLKLQSPPFGYSRTETGAPLCGSE